jgi:hypothetical protein
MELINFSVREKIFSITALVILTGKDVIVIVSGGREHIGAVGVSLPALSHVSGELSSSTSVITVAPHKEDVVVKLIGERLAKSLNRTVSVIAGIHFDNLKKEDIDTILNCCEKLTLKIIDRLG